MTQITFDDHTIDMWKQFPSDKKRRLNFLDLFIPDYAISVFRW